MKKKICLVLLTCALLSCGQNTKLPPPIQGMEKDIAQRIQNRDFPSVFQAWSTADNLKEDKLTTYARHDLIFHGTSFFKLEWNNHYVGLATGFTEKSIQEGLVFRRQLLARNPNLVLLAEIRYRDANKSYLPKNSGWWMRDAQKVPVAGWKEGGFLRMNLENENFQDNVAAKASAAVRSGVADGIMLDWWNENEYGEARLSLLKKVREAIGPDALIIVNSNDREMPASAPYVNGLFMECYRSETAEQWDSIAHTLRWAEANLRQPTINCLESWYHQSRQDLHLMRSVTTLTLTQSNGYCLFSDPNKLPKPDHLHGWYSFWDVKLGKPVETGRLRADGAWERRFENGLVVYNPMSNQRIQVELEEEMRSVAQDNRAMSFAVSAGEGDIFLH